LYFTASRCWMIGRADDGVRYGEAGLALCGDDRYDAGTLGCSYFWASVAHVYAGRPDLMVDRCRAEIQTTGDPHALARAGLLVALGFLGRTEEASAMADEAIAAAEASTNPTSHAYAL